MKKKTVGIIIVSVLVLALAGMGVWSSRDLSQKRLLRAADAMVFADVDSAACLLAQVDTTRLTEDSQMLHALLRALVHEEQWQLSYADTASCLSSGDMWSFKRTTTYNRADEGPVLADSLLLRVYHYFERASLGGTTNDKDDLRLFGRLCYAMSRNGNERAPLLNTDKLLHLAIHCAEASEDHALAFRAYRLLGQNTEEISQLLCATRALEHYRQGTKEMSLRDGAKGSFSALLRKRPCGPSAKGDGRWLLTLVNDYGCAVLRHAPFDLSHFPTVERMAAASPSPSKGGDVWYANTTEMAVESCNPTSPPSEGLGEASVFQCLDSLQALPAPKFMSATLTSHGKCDESDSAYKSVTNVEVPVDMYEEARLLFDENDENRKRKPDFETAWKNAIDGFNTSQDTYLAAGYVMKTASLQRRLMSAAIVILLLTLLLLGLLFRSWRVKARQHHEAERIAHQREAEQLAERLRQKDAMIAMLRGHIMDKSEILDMLEPKAGKRTIINSRNWREIEMTLDTADGNFVSRLRAAHPQFTEEDIRLCMLTRLRLSNTALSAIYLISVSAVQHRKQKLKKEGFGVTEPTVTLDQVIANF